MMTWSGGRRKLYAILNAREGDNWTLKVDDVLLSLLILLNVLAAILETVKPIHERYSAVFNGFELFSLAVFSLEYLLRVWVSVEAPGLEGRFKRLRFMATPVQVLDLVVLAPLFLPHFTTMDLRFLRLFRVLRSLRILKLSRYFDSLHAIGRVLKRQQEHLIVIFIALGVVITVASSVVYLVEHEAQPAVFSSIPATMWWAVATLSTVGYGDMFPVTTGGKACAAIISLCGIGIFALPAGVLASGFVEEIQSKKKPCCPHCHRELT
ncbi:MAG: ion transporter [Geothrix sp.]|nr:ion transporter [Geothrix sp.]